MQKLNRYIKNVPSWVCYILAIYIVSRLVLIIFGIEIQNGNLNVIPFADFKYAGSSFLNSWSKWDTGFYTEIAVNGYNKEPASNGFRNYAFFPLYPIFINLVNNMIHNIYLSGWIISNLSFILSTFVLYKLARIDFDEKYSLRIVRYLYLLPMAFIFSAVLSEGLFVLLLLLSIYFARKHKWMISGIIGILLSITKVQGILILIPLFIEYLESIQYKINRIRFLDLFGLLLPLIGFISFCTYSYFTISDPLAFIHAQSLWGKSFGNPAWFIIMNIFYGARSNAVYALIILLLIFCNLSKLRFSYWLLSMLLLLIPLSMGVSSIPRYTMVIFPLAYILTETSRNKTVDYIFTIILITLQLYVFAKWQAGHFFTI